MASRRRPPAPDQTQRDAAIAERALNVLIDAGAGTGKTTILVDRLIEALAPAGGGPAIPIERIAAITFTRKAAGELRLRIRERLLQELGEPGVLPERRERLRAALAGLDTAHVGTIHSFADRLLRLRPVEAALSPSYQIVEDEETLVRETFDVLMQAVQTGRLAVELAGTGAAPLAGEATSTVLLALAAGLPAESRETEWYTFHGLAGLVGGFIGERDVPPPDVTPAGFDAAAFRAVADEIIILLRRVDGESVGAVWLARALLTVRRLREIDEPVVLLSAIRQLNDGKPRAATKRDTFAGDNTAWQAWQSLMKDTKRSPVPLMERLRAPLDRWLATRLARVFPVVVALYEKVKARHRVLDQLDLLIKLRDLLGGNLAVRGEYQRMFDHIFVDEFQDTDPLQAEIVLFLCEREPRASRWDEVVLRDGALTLVGDPKQSIYRFRRADVKMYDRVRQVVAGGPHLAVQLSANFRSRPSLIDWLNDRFDRVLGTSPDGRPFDPATGGVYQQRLLPGRPGAPLPAVHVLPFDFADTRKHNVDEYRRLEARALARYLRWLVEASDVRVEDPLDGRPRRVSYGDIAVLAITTWRLSLLFPMLDAEGIPWASRGGVLFLSDPLHRQLLLGLRALADRDDGVAEAALLRPPFFAIDLADLARERTTPASEAGDEGVHRVREARELVRELRRQRLDRPPGATARDLLERSAFARAVARGPNGAQRLARARELCLLLEQSAATDGLDYDAATARLRAWVGDPIQLDPPAPVGTEAGQVLTVHQAKGLEFPVVVLWDGKGQWDARLDTGPWKMERDGRGWLLNLDGLAWEEPADLDLRETEKAYLNAERRRIGYVAATRARDLLVLPKAGLVPARKLVCGDLLAGCDPSLVHELELFREGAPPAWARAVGAVVQPESPDATAIERAVTDQWIPAAAEAARPRFRPASVSAEADAIPRDEAVGPVARKPRPGRLGHVFGTAVHQAIGLVFHHPGLAVPDAVRRAARGVGLTEHLDDAVADVTRALAALRAEGLTGPPGANLQIEYPIAGGWDGGVLLSGYVDLLGAVEDRLDVVDFKTDAPPDSAVEQTHGEYVAQVRAYGRLLEVAGVAAGRRLRCGLLFTAEGAIRWV